jgi:hypothetical protein
LSSISDSVFSFLTSTGPHTWGGGRKIEKIEQTNINTTELQNNLATYLLTKSIGNEGALYVHKQRKEKI